MAKLPAFQFYPGDWLKDPELRACSLAARGLWMDMLCLMHENDRRGYFQLNGKSVTAEQAARMTGCPTDEISRLLRELIDSGAASCTDTGIIFNRRMVRDEHKRNLCIEAGKRGGNPTLIRRPKGGLKGEITPSSSSLSSSSDQNQKKKSSARGIGWTPAAGWTGIDDAQIASWAAAFPACDIPRQLAAMGAWLRANPQRAVKSNWARFVVNWLKGEQDRGGDIRASGANRGQAAASTGAGGSGGGNRPGGREHRRPDGTRHGEYAEPTLELPIFGGGGGSNAPPGGIPATAPDGHGEPRRAMG